VAPVTEVTLRDGSVVSVRPLETGESGPLREIFEGMGEESRYLRFLAPMPEIDERGLAQLADIDHHHHEALLALGDERAVGVARFVRSDTDPEAAEVAVTVADELLELLTERAREEGIRRYLALVSAENRRMRGLLEEAGAPPAGPVRNGQVEYAFDLPHAGLGESLRRALRAVRSWHVSLR